MKSTSCIEILIVVLGLAHAQAAVVPGPTWDLQRCSNINPVEDSKTIFLSSFGKWPVDKFCIAIRTDLKVNDDAEYTMTVNFNNIRGGSNGSVGQVGFAFNYWDAQNYDFVYKRYC